MFTSHEPPDLSQKFLNQYFLTRNIGGGAAGQVYEAIETRTDERYAIKLINKSDYRSYKDEVDAFNAISTEPDSQTFIVTLKESGEYVPSSRSHRLSPSYKSGEAWIWAKNQGVRYRIVEQSYYYLVTELMGGDVFSILEKPIDIDGVVMGYMVLLVLNGLQYIHRQDLAHRDIKPENILYKTKDATNEYVSIEECLSNITTAQIYLKLKYGDLGFTCTDALAKETMGYDIRECGVFEGTKEFVAPELINLSLRESRNISLSEAQSADIWALGVTIWIMIYRNYPPFLWNSFDLEYTTDQFKTDIVITLNPEYLTAMFENPIPIENKQIAFALKLILKGFLDMDPSERTPLNVAITIMSEAIADYMK